jgi:large subunit ribosomal protein L4
MDKLKTYSVKGTLLEATTLPRGFTAEVNLRTLAQAIRVYEDKAHFGLRKTQTRAEVNRTKKKWYKQKGTGGARHGAKSAPIFVGGGVAHGPRPIKRELNLTKQLTKNALQMALSLKMKEGSAFAVSGLDKIGKTKDAQIAIVKVASDRKTVLALSEKNLSARRYFKNLKNVTTLPYRNLNAYQVFSCGVILFDKDIFAKEKIAKKEIKSK